MHYEGEQPFYPHPTADYVLQGLIVKAAGDSDDAITANLTEVEVEQAAPSVLPLIIEEVANADFNYQDTVEGYLSATIEAVAERVPPPQRWRPWGKPPLTRGSAGTRAPRYSRN